MSKQKTDPMIAAKYLRDLGKAELAQAVEGGDPEGCYQLKALQP